MRAEDGTLLLTYFDKHKSTADWRATKELPQGSIGVFSGRLKWFNNQWQLTNPDSKMFSGADGDLAQACESWVGHGHPGVDVVLYEGGQDRYPLLVAVE